jgi:hypothetical protein
MEFNKYRPNHRDIMWIGFPLQKKISQKLSGFENLLYVGDIAVFIQDPVTTISCITAQIRKARNFVIYPRFPFEESEFQPQMIKFC